MKRVFLDSLFKDWILGGIIRESAAVSAQKISIKHVSTRKISLQNIRSKFLGEQIDFMPGDILVNQGTLFTLIDRNRINLDSLPNLHCYFTHDSTSRLISYQKILTQLKLIYVMNRQDLELLVGIGVDPKRIRIVYGAIDSNIFYPREHDANSEAFIYLTGDAKGRKNPDKVLELIGASPELKFVINGRFWPEYIRNRKIHLKNLTVMNFDSKQNPELMRKASCFLSLSLHEGGPYPVLEALASGTPVVTTPTGWNPELIFEMNGCLVGFDITIPELKVILQRMITLKVEVCSRDLTNAQFSWGRLATLLYES